jgi:hypothetical protein
VQRRVRKVKASVRVPVALPMVATLAVLAPATVASPNRKVRSVRLMLLANLPRLVAPVALPTTSKQVRGHPHAASVDVKSPANPAGLLSFLAGSLLPFRLDITPHTA